MVQLAKKEGMRVIGSVSSADKAKYVTEELGADECFNYKEERCIDALKRLAPEGLDVVYENVGGDHFEAAIANMKDFGRIIVCGMVSGPSLSLLVSIKLYRYWKWNANIPSLQVALYNQSPEEQYKVTNLPDIFRKRILIQGFIFWDDNIYTPNIDRFWEMMPQWIADGSIKTRTTHFEGFDKVQEAFLSVFSRTLFGKATLKVAES